MRIKEGFTIRPLCGEHIVVGEGLSQVNFNKMLSLNDSAAYLWEQASGKDFTCEDLVALLLDRYEVSAEQAMEDVKKMVAIWQEHGVLE
ncbi:MAG: PqqD family protein [Bacteroidales bacterium]|nr:PqqD family protein [Bacteroidales bacterium]